MKVTVNLETCDTHGDCVVEAPDVFDLDDAAAFVTVLQPEPPEDLREAVERAADACPVSAITIEG
jgi:ferredoxin